MSKIFFKELKSMVFYLFPSSTENNLGFCSILYQKIEPSYFFSSPQYIGNQGVINEPLVINATPEGYSISHKNSLKKRARVSENTTILNIQKYLVAYLVFWTPLKSAKDNI